MEYYILKLYQNEKQKCSEIEQGFERYEPKVKKIVIVGFIVMVVSYAEIILTSLLFPKQLWSLVGIIVCVGTMFFLVWIDNKDEKEHMDKYVDSHKKKIEILDKVLSNEFQIKTKEKVEELIILYQEYIDKKKEEEKKRNSLIITIFSVVAGVLSISFENMGLLGINFNNWIYLATILSLLVAFVGFWIYSYTYFDTLKRKYKIIIKELKELLLIRY